MKPVIYFVPGQMLCCIYPNRVKEEIPTLPLEESREGAVHALGADHVGRLQKGARYVLSAQLHLSALLITGC